MSLREEWVYLWMLGIIVIGVVSVFIVSETDDPVRAATIAFRIATAWFAAFGVLFASFIAPLTLLFLSLARMAKPVPSRAVASSNSPESNQANRDADASLFSAHALVPTSAAIEPDQAKRMVAQTQRQIDRLRNEARAVSSRMRSASNREPAAESATRRSSSLPQVRLSLGG